MAINLSDNTPRQEYTVSDGNSQQVFAVPFEFFDDGDLNVYQDGVLKTLTTHYRTADNNDASNPDDHTSGTTGYIHFTSTITASGADIKIVITRAIDIERSTDFPTSGPFDIASLNTGLDKVIAIQADLQDDIARSLRLTDYDIAATLTLPDVDTRKGKTLAFNATSGAVEAGPSIADVQTVSAASADIATLADIEDGTDSTDAIQTVAGISGNVTTVAGISGNVTTVAGISANTTTVAGIQANVTTVAGIEANVTTVANISGDVTTVANDETDIGTVAGISSDVTTVAGIDSDVTAVAGIQANVTTVAGINTTHLANVSGVATNVALLGTSDGVADLNTLAAISTDITSLADSLEKTYVVTVANSVFVLGSDANPAIEMFRGNTYIFDVSDSSVSGHPLAFKDGSGNSWTSGVTTSGTAGTTGATVTFEVPSNAPASMRYYCTAHGNGMGNTITVKDSNISLVAGISTEVATVAGISSDVTTVAGDATDIATVAAADTNIATVATNITNVNNVGGDIANVNSVGTDIANVNTVANNLSGVNSFGERYRVSATAPSTSLDSGDLWFDTTNNLMKVYGDSGFVNAGSSVNGTSSRNDYVVGTASGTYTGSTTDFPATYDAGYVDVYLNGIKLQPADFTASSGTNVVLSSAAQTSDTVSIVGYGTFELSNFSINDANDVNTAGITNGQVLAYNTTTSDFEATTINSDLVDDTTPQLGGTLDTNGNAIQFGSSKWTIELDGNNLVFKYNGTAKIKFADDGEIVTVDDVTAFGTI